MPRKRILTPFAPNTAPEIPAPIKTDINQNRTKIFGFTPIGSVAGCHRLNEVDGFYIKCQKHRDFYKDLSGRLHPQFYARMKRFSTRPDPTSTYLKIPTSRYEEHKPVAYPVTMGRTGLNSRSIRFG